MDRSVMNEVRACVCVTFERHSCWWPWVSWVCLCPGRLPLGVYAPFHFTLSPPHHPTRQCQANLTNAILERAVFTRSDLGGAIVDGADFTNALLDKALGEVDEKARLDVLNTFQEKWVSDFIPHIQFYATPARHFIQPNIGGFDKVLGPWDSGRGMTQKQNLIYEV